MMDSLLHRYRWKLAQPEASLVEQIRSSLTCSETLASIIARRYGREFGKFAKGEETGLHPPERLPDMTEAVQRIEGALKRQERIFIHGDFDTDGLASAAILYRGLDACEGSMKPSSLKVNVGNRRMGHGIDSSTSSRLVNEEFDLLITTDCGIKANEEISYLTHFGVDVIVTDHHEPASTLPPAVAVVDPKRPDNEYQNPQLSGAGVAFKLITALNQKLGLSPSFGNRLIQLATLGTVADLSPLIKEGEDENRRLVAKGLEMMSEKPIPGLHALMKETNLTKDKITAKDISYRIAPKLNAANRVGDPKVGFLLLITENTDRARYLTKTLMDYDRDRSIVQGRITRQAQKQFEEANGDPEEKGALIVVGDDWNPGILGLVASRLTNKYSLPSAVLTAEGNCYRGSIRSIQGINIIEALNHCSKYLNQFGGHQMAGGFQVGRQNLPKFRSCFSQWCKDQLKEVDSSPAVKELDAELAPDQISLDLFEELGGLRPFGIGNPEPKFLMRDAEVKNPRKVGKNKNHLKMDLGKDHTTLDCIGFSLGEALEEIQSHSQVNLAFRLEKDNWSDAGVQLVLEDFLL